MSRKYVLWLIGLGSAIVVLLVALIVVVATDDGDDGTAAGTGPTTTAAPATSATAPPTTATTAPPTTATTAAPATTATTAAPTTTTTTPPTTTTTTPPPACVDAGPIPGTAAQVSHVAADYDGDGLPDDFAAYELGSSWFLWADLSDGGYRLVTEIGLPWSFEYWDGTTPGPLTVLAAHTLGDPRQAATVRLYQGLGAYYALFGVQDCEIVPFVEPGGTIPELWTAMGPAYTTFPECDDAAGVVRQTSISCGGALSTCPTLDESGTEYQVSRDPAGLTFVTDYTAGIDQAEYQATVLRSCLEPPG